MSEQQDGTVLGEHGEVVLGDMAFAVVNVQGRLSLDGARELLRPYVAALTAAADRAGEERARRECAEELRRLVRRPCDPTAAGLAHKLLMIAKLPDEWSTASAPSPPSGADGIDRN